MSQQFNWYTEDETGWGDEEPVQPPVRQKLTTQPWRQFVVVAVVIASLVWTLIRQVEQRVDSATEAASNDIRSSYTLMARAVTNKDPELFNTVVDSHNAAWVAVQHRLLTEGLHFDRYPLGIEALTAVPQLVAINPSPDLDEAEVTVAGQYSNFEMGPVTLHQSFVFRRGSQSWHLSPLPSDFWGPWEMAHGRSLTLVFRQRDNAIARRLLQDLDAQVGLMCATLADIHCPEDLNLSVRLASDPVTLLKTADSALETIDRIRLDLPTPSLVGLPVDEQGYQVLLHSYARPVVVAAIAKAVGWECCERALFYQALLDYQLNELGLQPWPLTPIEYETMFINPVVNLPNLERFWSAPSGSEPGWQQVYSVMAYILNGKSSLSAATMQRYLISADDFWPWMYRLVPDFPASNAHQDWIRYAQSNLSPLDVSLPSEDVLLLCDSVLGETSSLYRYDMGEAVWHVEHEAALFMSMSAAADRDGVFLLERLKQIRRTRAMIWRGENAGQLFVQPLTGGLFRIDIGGEILLIYLHDYLEPFAALQQIEMTECEDSKCQTTIFTGFPIGSPDGKRTLIAGQDGIIWLGNSQGAPLWPMGKGTAPFWLDNNSYGFLRLEEEEKSSLAAIAVADVVNHDTQTLVRLEALATAVSADTNLGELTIDAMKVSPANPDLLFVAASVVNRENLGKSYVFVVNRQSSETELLTVTNYRFGRHSLFDSSPNHHWLTINTFDRHSGFWQLHLFDSRTGQAQTLTSAYPYTINGYDWSPDNQWLLRVQDGYLHLLNPAQGEHLIINHEYSNCRFAAWAGSTFAFGRERENLASR